MGRVATIILLMIIFTIALAPLLPIPNPDQTDPMIRLEGPMESTALGTDHLGRDLLSRIIYGGQTSMILGAGSVGFGLTFGVPIGLIAGYSSGFIDESLMRAMDLLMSFPALLLALLLLAALGGSLWNAILAVGIVFVPRIARVVRGSTLAVTNEQFVAAAEVRGESTVYILFREILPNIMSAVVVEGTVRFGYGVLLGTSLSFLGLGTQPPNSDWGVMISNAREYIFQSPWYLIWPIVLLSVTVICLNIMGDALRDILDPETEGEL